MNVYVHSFALSLVALHCNPSEQPWRRQVIRPALLRQLRDSGSVMYVCVHSFAFALASLHCDLFERFCAGCP